jgi:hypothetical protein
MVEVSAGKQRNYIGFEEQSLRKGSQSERRNMWAVRSHLTPQVDNKQAVPSTPIHLTGLRPSVIPTVFHKNLNSCKKPSEKTITVKEIIRALTPPITIPPPCTDRTSVGF